MFVCVCVAVPVCARAIFVPTHNNYDKDKFDTICVRRTQTKASAAVVVGLYTSKKFPLNFKKPHIVAAVAAGDDIGVCRCHRVATAAAAF